MAANTPDTEQGSTGKEQLPGFAATAGFIANDPAKTTVIFRRFDKLAIRNLLYLEARLAALEILQQSFDQIDLELKNNEPITTAARSWEAFAIFGTSGRAGGTNSWALPQSALKHWRSDRKSDVKDYIQHAGDGGKVIRKDPESKGKSVETGESAGPAREAIFSGPSSSQAPSTESVTKVITSVPSSLQEIWDLVQAIEDTLKHHRMLSMKDYMQQAGDGGNVIRKDPESKEKTVEKGEPAEPAREVIFSGPSSSQQASKEPVAKDISSDPSSGQGPSAKSIPESAPSDTSAAHDPLEDLALAKAESDLLYDNPLGCGPRTLKLLQERWDLAQAIDDTLKNYQETVLRYRDMLKLEPPAPRTRNVVSDWIGGRRPASNGKEVKAAEQFLPGSSMHTIYAQEETSEETSSQEQTDDLVGIGRIGGIDLLTRWVSTWKCLFIFKDKNFPYPEIDRVPERIVHTTVTILTIILGVVLVIGGIWGLYYLRTEQDSFPADLGLLSGLIVMFGLSIKLMTMASRTELFIATAGYTAVMIVFVAFQAPQHSQTFNVNVNGTLGNGTISG